MSTSPDPVLNMSSVRETPFSSTLPFVFRFFRRLPLVFHSSFCLPHLFCLCISYFHFCSFSSIYFCAIWYCTLHLVYWFWPYFLISAPLYISLHLQMDQHSFLFGSPAGKSMYYLLLHNKSIWNPLQSRILLLLLHSVLLPPPSACFCFCVHFQL